MKRKLFLSAILIIAMVFMFVACSNEVAAPANKLGKITIGGDAGKAISTVVTYSSDVEQLYWYYKATKLDDGYTTGAKTNFVPVAVAGNPESADKGLSGKILHSDGFSYGFWEIELKGFKNQDGSGNAEYTAKITNFLVKADMNYATAVIEVGENATTSIEFGDIWFSADNIKTDSKFSLAVTDGANTITVDNNEQTDDTDTAYMVVSDSEVKFKGITFSGTEVGTHEMKFVLTQALSGEGNTTIKAALYTLNFNVIKGTKTTISGDMVKNDQTGDIQINGVQNVDPITISKVIPVQDGAQETSATVKTTTTIQIGDLKVTYPQNAIIVPGTDGLATNQEGTTSDGTVGFEYKGTDHGSIAVNATTQNVANYELTLSAPTDSINTTLITIEKFIGKSLMIENVYHEDSPLLKVDNLPTPEGNEHLLPGDAESYFYDSTSGTLYLFVKHASQFYIVSKQAVALIDGAPYYTLENALMLAESGQTVNLLQNNIILQTAEITVKSNVTLNLNNHTLITLKNITNNGIIENGTIMLVSSQIQSKDYDYKTASISGEGSSDIDYKYGYVSSNKLVVATHKVSAEGKPELYCGSYNIQMLSYYNVLPNNSTITILQDNTSPYAFFFNKEGDTINLNLNGHVQKFIEEKCIWLKGETLNLIGTGIIETIGSEDNPVWMEGAESNVSNYSVLNVGKDVTLKTNSDYAVGFYSEKDVYGIVMNINGTLDGALSVTGNTHQAVENYPHITIGETARVGYIYGAGYGQWDVYGKVIDSTGIEMRAGILNVYPGAQIKGTETPTTVQANGNGQTTLGAGVAISQHSTKLPITVNIQGGTIEGFTAFFETNPQGNGQDSLQKININITGGEFKAINGGTNSVYSEDCTCFVFGGIFNSDPSDYIADGYKVQTKSGTTAESETLFRIVSSSTVESDGWTNFSPN